MALDEKRQALLDTFCHCYAMLLDHLDALDEGARDHPAWSNYDIVRKCINPAAEIFGADPADTLDLSDLCSDLLNRMRGLLVGVHLPRCLPVADAFDNYRAAVKAVSPAGNVDLTEWQRVGEELSLACYRAHAPAESPHLTRTVIPVSIVAAKECAIYCHPQKHGGESTITFAFAPNGFSFDWYVNLPLYFFHEYLSHLHTAPLFNESNPGNNPFEDGWLLRLAQSAYTHRLLHDRHLALSHPLHRDHYARRYFESLGEVVGRPWVTAGYDQARRFYTRVGPDLFRAVTVLIALSPYDHFGPAIPDLHRAFVQRVRGWLERTATWPTEAKRAALDDLRLRLEGLDPLRAVFDFLAQS